MVEGQRELDLRKWGYAVRRRWPVMAICTLALVLLAVGLSLTLQDQYEGEARILVQPRASEAVFEVGSRPGLDPQLAIETEIEIIESPSVRRAVQDRIGDVPEVEADRVGETLMVELRTRDPDPERAARITNTFAREYIEFRREQAVQDLLSAGAVIEGEVAETRAEIAEQERRIAAAPPQEQQGLQVQLQALISQLAVFEQRLDEVQVEAALKTGGAQLVSEATVPEEPVSPRPLRNGILASMVGLLLGSLLAALLEYLDESVNVTADLEAISGGLPVLAVIPPVPAWKRSGPRPRDLISTESSAPVAEAYRNLRTAVELIRGEHALSVLQVTSPGSGDGKTTTISGLAVMLAKLGRRVVLVDGDLRRSRLHHLFGVPGTAGLSTFLRGQPGGEVPRVVFGVDRLFLVPAGPVPPNPSELLADPRLSAHLRELANTFDIVLIDSPPVLPVTDATVLAAAADATLLVATAGRTTVRQVEAAADRLRHTGAPLIGAVLNAADRDAQEQGYSYGYASDEDGGGGGNDRGDDASVAPGPELSADGREGSSEPGTGVAPNVPRAAEPFRP